MRSFTWKKRPPLTWVSWDCFTHKSLALGAKVWELSNEDKSLVFILHGFSSSHGWMWELYHKEGWVPKNWCFWTVVLEKTLESPLDCMEIKSVHPKGNHSWIFIRRTDAEAETPTLWPPDRKSWLIGKDPDAGKDWRQEEKGTTEDEMVGWHHWLNGHEFEESSKRWWRTGKPGMLQSMGSQKVGNDWVTEQEINHWSLRGPYLCCSPLTRR